MTEPGRRRLGDILVARGTLSEEELAMVLAEQRRTGQLLGELVVALGLATSSAVAAALADKHGWSNVGDVTGSDGAIAATAASEPPPARPQAEERSEDESAPESADAESRAPVLQTSDVPQSQSEASDPPAEARAHAAAQAAVTERLRRALTDQAAAAERSSAELEAVRTDLARAEIELAAAHEALESRAIELETLRHELQQQQPPRETAEQFDADRHLLFLPTPGGYRLVERSGPAPKPGSRVDVGGGLGGRSGYLVLKTIRAPLPATRLLCAYLQPL